MGKERDNKLHWTEGGKKERKQDQNRKKKRRVEALKSCGQQRGGGVTSSGGEKRVTHLKRGRGGRKVDNCPCIQLLWSTREDPPYTHACTPNRPD